MMVWKEPKRERGRNWRKLCVASMKTSTLERKSVSELGSVFFLHQESSGKNDIAVDAFFLQSILCWI